MYPAIANGVVRLAASSRWGAFTASLSKASGVVLRSAEDVITWAKSNKGAAALIAASLLDAGVSIADFFKGEEKGSAVKAAAAEMSKFAGADPALVKSLLDLLGNDGDNFKLKLSSNEELDKKLARVTLAYIKSNLLFNTSSADVVLELHAALQLFTQLSRDNVADLMNDRITPVPDYSSSTMRGVLLAGL